MVNGLWDLVSPIIGKATGASHKGKVKEGECHLFSRVDDLVPEMIQSFEGPVSESAIALACTTFR